MKFELTLDVSSGLGAASRARVSPVACANAAYSLDAVVAEPRSLPLIPTLSALTEFKVMCDFTVKQRAFEKALAVPLTAEDFVEFTELRRRRNVAPSGSSVEQRAAPNSAPPTETGGTNRKHIFRMPSRPGLGTSSERFLNRARTLLEAHAHKIGNPLSVPKRSFPGGVRNIRGLRY